MAGSYLHLLLPLLAGAIFAASSLAFKRAFAEGAQVVHALVVTNVGLGLLFLPLLALEGRPVPWERAAEPVIVGSAFFAGHLFNVLALRVGDVSVATPLLGTKVVFVAAFGWLLFRQVPGVPHIAAAALTAMGVFVMGLSELRQGTRAGIGTALALKSAAAFGFCDVLIQQWAGTFGTFHFLPLMFGAVGLESAVLIPFFLPELRAAPAPAWRWLLAGVVGTAAQGLLITGTIAHWHDATGVNVVYGLRGLWAIGLVWVLGHWFGNRERETAGRRRFGLRIAGASMIVAAVVLIAQARLPGR